MQEYVKCVYEVYIQRITLHFGYFVHTHTRVCVCVCVWGGFGKGWRQNTDMDA